MKTLQRIIHYEDFLRTKLYETVLILGTRSGFIDYYFSILHRFRKYTAAFRTLNDLYYMIFGRYKYSSYHSFKKQRKNYLKN